MVSVVAQHTTIRFHEVAGACHENTGARGARAEALPRVLEGRGHRRLDWEPKQFLDFISLKSLDPVRAVAAGARLGRDVRGQNRRDRAAPCRA